MGKQMNKIDYLKEQHKKIHERIEALEAEKAPEKYITDLKKQKLSIKDQISRYDNKTNISI